MIIHVLTKDEFISNGTIQHFKMVHVVTGSIIDVDNLACHDQLLRGLPGGFGAEEQTRHEGGKLDLIFPIALLNGGNCIVFEKRRGLNTQKNNSLQRNDFLEKFVGSVSLYPMPEDVHRRVQVILLAILVSFHDCVDVTTFDGV